VACGSNGFKHSRLQPRHWYCRGCNKRYEDSTPLVTLTWCSEHGTTFNDNDESVTCPACKEEADTTGARIDHATPEEAIYADWEQRIRERLSK
jgi:hypothetical protein